MDNEIIISKFGPATIKYKLRSVDYASQNSGYTNTVSCNGEGMWKQMVESIPESFLLEGNYPNPFNPVTTIPFDLPEPSLVTLTIYDLMGREVRTLVQGEVPAGFQQAQWNGKDNQGRPIPSGMYLYRLSAQATNKNQTYTQTRKLVVLK